MEEEQEKPLMMDPSSIFMSNVPFIHEEDDGIGDVEEAEVDFLHRYVDIRERSQRRDDLIEDLKEKIRIGQGETIVSLGQDEGGEQVGLSPSEWKQSIESLNILSSEISATCSRVFQRNISSKKKQKVKEEEDPEEEKIPENALMCGEFLIRHNHEPEQLDYVDIRLAIVGNVDSGKSTLIGVLINGKLDNGRGEARRSVFKFKHEADTGRTSAVSLQIMGFDSAGSIVNYRQKHGSMNWTDICLQSSKILTFIDLAGHERYLKTTMYGCTAAVPDYAVLVVGSNMGVQRMTKEHLGICLALKIPFCIALTKIDLCPKNVLKNTMANLRKILTRGGVRKIPLFVRNERDVFEVIQNIGSARVCPIFLLSNVTGEGQKVFKKFLNLVPKRHNFEEKQKLPPEFFIDGIYYVSGVGTVVSGVVTQGVIKDGDYMFIGPDGNGNFRKTQIKSIQCKRVNVEEVRAGVVCTIALRKEKRNHLRKGMVLVKEKKMAKACWEFSAEVLVLYHSTTIKENYQPVIHCENVRQSAKIISMDQKSIRTGDKAVVNFRWICRPEYMKEGARMIFREGRTKGIGKVKEIKKDI